MAQRARDANERSCFHISPLTCLACCATNSGNYLVCDCLHQVVTQTPMSAPPPQIASVVQASYSVTEAVENSTLFEQTTLSHLSGELKAIPFPNFKPNLRPFTIYC